MKTIELTDEQYEQLQKDLHALQLIVETVEVAKEVPYFVSDWKSQHIKHVGEVTEGFVKPLKSILDVMPHPVRAYFDPNNQKDMSELSSIRAAHAALRRMPSGYSQLQFINRLARLSCNDEEE